MQCSTVLHQPLVPVKGHSDFEKYTTVKWNGGNYKDSRIVRSWWFPLLTFLGSWTTLRNESYELPLRNAHKNFLYTIIKVSLRIHDPKVRNSYFKTAEHNGKFSLFWCCYFPLITTIESILITILNGCIMTKLNLI
jgi:hypothetical protein